MYILVNVLNKGDNSSSKFHLLEYNLEENKENIMELKTDSRMVLAKSKLEDNKLYMVMSNDYDGSTITELNLLTYNIVDKNLNEDKYVLDNREKREIRNIEIDSNKIIVYTSKLHSILSWDNKSMLYIINKNSKEVVYEGELQFNSSNSKLEFEIKQVS